MTDAPILDRKHGVTPATRMMTKLSPDAGKKFTSALTQFALNSLGIASGVGLVVTALALGAPVVVTLAAVAVTGMVAALANHNIKELKEIANQGERVQSIETVRSDTTVPSTSIKSRPAGSMG